MSREFRALQNQIKELKNEVVNLKERIDDLEDLTWKQRSNRRKLRNINPYDLYQRPIKNNKK